MTAAGAPAGPAASAIHNQLPVRPDWLDQVAEPVLRPELPIVDAHHHLWDAPGRRYLFDECLADLSTGHKVVATVFVQCHAMYRSDGPVPLRPVGETEFVCGAAAQSASGQYGPARMCAAIVGSLDPTLGDAAGPVIEAHLQAGGGRFRGIRLRTSWHESAEVHQLPTPQGVLMDGRTRRAIAQVERHGLTLDVWCFHTQMDEVVDVCRAFPGLTVIINHVAGPIGVGPYRGRRDEVFAAWRDGIRTLAGLPNTLMKIGGMAMRFTGHDFHLRPRPPTSDELAAAWRPYAEACIEAFGADRCMFESNFPVDKAMCSYAVLWNAFKKLALDASADERGALLAGTARRAYAIPAS